MTTFSSNDSRCFIESQFPVSMLSKESYKERKAGSSQTLTGLGKWWGRKPLVLVRACLIGCLMPVSDNPEKDRDIFLKIMTMDDAGLLKRKNKSCPVKIVYENEDDRAQGRGQVLNEYGKVVFRGKIPDRQTIQQSVFASLSYRDKLKYCTRPEEIDGPSEDAWQDINAHLGTDAHNLTEFVQQLGMKRFGRIPKVGDCFCGGGSNVFEPARLGCEVYASDLNPIAGLLTWGSLNLLKADETGQNPSEVFIQHCYEKLKAFYEELGVDRRSNGYINKYYLYCTEIVCPDCGVTIPLLPTRVISVKHKAYVTLHHNTQNNNFDFRMHINDDADGYNQANNGTVDGGHIVCPYCRRRNSIFSLRDLYLKNWTRTQFIPRSDDLFQERLYAIMCVDHDQNPTFICPEQEDLDREQVVTDYISDHFSEWQEKGYIPSNSIESGYNNDQPIRERGWKYWHQLFNPRHILLNGKFNEIVLTEAQCRNEFIVGILTVGNLLRRSSKLVVWDKSRDMAGNGFSNQALNTVLTFSSRSCSSIHVLISDNFLPLTKENRVFVDLADARTVKYRVDIAITDPPYADAVNYHELTEFFLAWDKTSLPKAFPEWYTDSKRALAIKGIGPSFNESMVDVYSNLSNHMSDNGIQILMFTHQNTQVWAELALVIWSAGLQVTTAWCIATETDSVGLKKGNYVKGTVLMVLRKRFSEDEVFPEDIRREIRYAVQHQIESMRNLDERSEPDFNDADYSLAAYAAALRVITSKKKIIGIDPRMELRRKRVKGWEKSPVQEMIEFASQEAVQYIIPKGIDSGLWRSLQPFDRYYLKGLDLERKGNMEMSSYQEIARTIGLSDYQRLFHSTKANHVRLRTGSETASKLLSMIRSEEPASRSLVAVALYTLYLCKEEGEDGDFSRILFWLRDDGLKESYWDSRSKLLEILDFFVTLRNTIPHWTEDSNNAEILIQLISSDGV